MITAKQVKDVAALVGAIAGIATGIDKVKSTIQKWKYEYRSNKGGTADDKTDKIDEQRSREDI